MSTDIFGAYGGRYVPETLIPALDEDEAEHVRARLDRRVDILLARQAAHLHERPRQQFAQLCLRIGRLHERGSHEDRVGSGQLGGRALCPRVHSTLGDDDAVSWGLCDERELRAAIDRKRR